MCFVLKPYTPQTFVIALRTSSLNLEHEMPYTTVKVSFGDSHLGPESRYGPSVFQTANEDERTDGLPGSEDSDVGFTRYVILTES